MSTEARQMRATGEASPTLKLPKWANAAFGSVLEFRLRSRKVHRFQAEKLNAEKSCIRRLRVIFLPSIFLPVLRPVLRDDRPLYSYS
jgi:hypothetical protein